MDDPFSQDFSWDLLEGFPTKKMKAIFSIDSPVMVGVLSGKQQTTLNKPRISVEHNLNITTTYGLKNGTFQVPSTSVLGS